MLMFGCKGLGELGSEENENEKMGQTFRHSSAKGNCRTNFQSVNMAYYLGSLKKKNDLFC